MCGYPGDWRWWLQPRVGTAMGPQGGFEKHSGVGRGKTHFLSLVYFVQGLVCWLSVVATNNPG